MSCPPKPPRPCECGCGEPIAQKQRNNMNPKRFASDACRERVAKAIETDAEYETRMARERATYHRRKLAGATDSR